MNKDSLGDRMKTYEGVTRHYLTRRMPTIIRIDGKAFHSFTKGLKKPFDNILINSMQETAKYLCENIQGCKIAYTQSDEISLLLTDYDDINTSAWFDNNISKVISISASMATLVFNKNFKENTNSLNDKNFKTLEEYLITKKIYEKKFDKALFDSRVFNIPKEDICNYFIWRQQDCIRNSIEMVGRTNFSYKQLYKVNCNQIQDKLLKEKNINWTTFPTYQKRGSCIIKEKYYLNDDNNTQRTRWIVDKNIPVFTENRDYIEKYL
ncbi:tRNA(His) guanylyltransferase Thg1 family protein [Clostridium sp. MT-14]|uniref:tRNA(His) guanylyltransferase Thg1 family protein n=1 Tax=Clostridium sp. MT-14 TaxID=3348360 RepID=UPI0035F2D768